MKPAKSHSIFFAVLLAAGLWGFGHPNDAFAGDVPPVGPSGPVGGSLSPRGGGGGEGAVKRWFREREERNKREREKERKNEQEYRATVDYWSQKGRENQEQYRVEQERNSKIQRENLLNARRKSEAMNHWNDAGIEAYQRGELGSAITYFKAAQRYAPESSDFRFNLQKAESILGAKAESYLSSLDTALDIVDVSPHLMIFHPDPYIRTEANRELARQTMQKVAEAAAAFVAENRLKGGTITPFPWETAAERMERRTEAMRHAEHVESLRLEALQEARESTEHLIVSDSKADIRIEPKPAMKQLLKICISGFE